MSNALELTKDNFDATTKSGITLVDFWAEWCGPCRMMSPVLDKLSAQYTDGVTIGKVNVDNEMELAQKFGVSSIPTLVLLKDGTEIKRYVGVTPERELAAAIDGAKG